MADPTVPAPLPAGWATLDATDRAALASADGGVSGPRERRRAGSLLAGALVLVAAGLVSVAESWRTVWAVAFLLGLVLLVRAVGAYRRSVGAGTSSVRRDGPMLAAAAVVAAGCLVGGGLAVGQLVDESKDARAATGAGSCWRAADATSYQPVDCSHAHRFVGTAVVASSRDCDERTAVVVTLGPARLVCLDGT